MNRSFAFQKGRWKEGWAASRIHCNYNTQLRGTRRGIVFLAEWLLIVDCSLIKVATARSKIHARRSRNLSTLEDFFSCAETTDQLWKNLERPSDFICALVSPLPQTQRPEEKDEINVTVTENACSLTHLFQKWSTFVHGNKGPYSQKNVSLAMFVKCSYKWRCKPIVSLDIYAADQWQTALTNEKLWALRPRFVRSLVEHSLFTSSCQRSCVRNRMIWRLSDIVYISGQKSLHAASLKRPFLAHLTGKKKKNDAVVPRIRSIRNRLEIV